MITNTSRPMVAVGVDDTSESIEALRYAAAVSRDRNWDLQVVHAYQIPPATQGLTEEILDHLRAAAETRVDDALSGLHLGPSTRIHRLVLPESPTVLLRDVSAWASMLVLGRHHVGLLDTMLTGRIGAAVARHAPCPVVVVPPGWSRANHDGRPVVVALDGETSAELALFAGCDEAERRHVPLVAMHAMPLHSKEFSLDEERVSLAALVAGAKQDHPDLDVQTLLVSGEPRARIHDESIVAGLVVVGHPHHHSGIGSWARSVARAVMDHSLCPLLIAPAARPEADQTGVRALSRSGR